MNFLYFEKDGQIDVKYSQNSQNYTDFGNAEFQNSEKLLPTPGYQPPEIYYQKLYNEKSDIFSLGCSFYNILNFDNIFTINDGFNKLLIRSLPGYTDEKYKEYFGEDEKEELINNNEIVNIGEIVDINELIKIEENEEEIEEENNIGELININEIEEIEENEEENKIIEVSEYPKITFDNKDDDLNDLLKAMLQFDNEKRLSIKELLFYL